MEGSGCPDFLYEGKMLKMIDEMVRMRVLYIGK